MKLELVYPKHEQILFLMKAIELFPGSMFPGSRVLVPWINDRNAFAIRLLILEIHIDLKRINMI